MTKKTVIIVEDEALIALSMAELLTKNGYHVIDLYSRGEDVLSALETSQKPDLILMDIVLSGTLNGIQTVRQIQDRFSIPIFFITAHNSEELVKEMDELNPDGIIKKPFIAADLLSLIGATIGFSKI